VLGDVGGRGVGAVADPGRLPDAALEVRALLGDLDAGATSTSRGRASRGRSVIACSLVSSL
jgi:hypothetical protein